MADQLATPTDLASYLQSDVDTSTATLLIECATAVVQEACGGMRIVQVDNDTLNVAGYTDSWLPLPQLPVRSVTSVTLDGITLAVGTDYKLFGNRLWRRQGWQNNCGWLWDSAGLGSSNYGYGAPSLTWPFQEPSQVVIVYSYGLVAGDQRLQFARSSALGLARGVYVNANGVSAESIDDYHITYEQMAARMEAAPHLKAALAKKYGRRAGVARVG